MMEKNLETPGDTDRRAEAVAEGRPWLVCAGALAHLHEKTVRIQQLVDEECGETEPKD